jgi:hypothetical protein
MLKELSTKLGADFESWDKLIAEFKKTKAMPKINFAQVPPRPQNTGSNTDWEATTKLNEEAKTIALTRCAALGFAGGFARRICGSALLSVVF